MVGIVAFSPLSPLLPSTATPLSHMCPPTTFHLSIHHYPSNFSSCPIDLQFIWEATSGNKGEKAKRRKGDTQGNNADHIYRP
jgi:hypothetical protein